MDVKDGYKLTEVGVVPEDWDVVTLSAVATASSGSTPSRSLSDRYYRQGTVDWVKTLDLNNSKIKKTQERITDLALKETSLKVYPSKSVLVAMYGGFVQIGRTGLLLAPSAINQALTAVVPESEKLDSQFLLFQLNYRVGYWKTIASSSRKDPNITGSDVRNLPVILPKVIEQQAIAEALSDADALIESLEQLIVKKQLIKQGAMQELLTGKRRLPGFDGEWRCTTLGEVVTFLSGGTPSRSNPDFWNGSVPWISASTLRRFYIYESDSNVTKAAVADGSKMSPVGASLLLVRGSALHKEISCGLVTQPVCFNQDVKALVPSSLVAPQYLTLLLRGRSADLHKLVSSAGNTAGVLDTKLLKSFEIYLPGNEEQTAIAQTLTDIDTEITDLESRLTKARQIKQGMMQELLTGRIRLMKPVAQTA